MPQDQPKNHQVSTQVGDDLEAAIQDHHDTINEQLNANLSDDMAQHVSRASVIRGLLKQGIREPTIRAAAEEALGILRTDWREFDDIRTDANEIKLDAAEKVLARALREVQG